ncbi:hypothetical protein ACOTVS_10005 [Aliarcobacter butzleri]
MRNILRIGLMVYIILGLSGCYDNSSREMIALSMAKWMIYLAYILPVIFALMYQFKVKNSRWYFTILIGFSIHLIWVGLVLFGGSFSFKEILTIFY